MKKSNKGNALCREVTEQDRRGRALEPEKVWEPVTGEAAAVWVDPLLPAPEEIVCAQTADMLSRICRGSHVPRKDVPSAVYR